MTWILVLATAVAGGIGAMLRFLVDGLVTAHSRLPIPLGTPVVNLTGSFALGLVTGAVAGALPADVRTVIGSGLLGGYTTFSTASTQNAELFRSAHPLLGLLYGGGMLAASLSGAAIGLWIGI